MGERFNTKVAGDIDAPIGSQEYAVTCASSEAQSPEEAGFTLSETLVALALMSLITAAVLGSIRFGLRSWEQTTLRATRIDQLLLAQDFIRRAISDTYPAFVASDVTHGYIDFSGTKTSIEFIATTPLSRNAGGRSRFTIALDASQLIVTSQPELAGSENISNIRDVLISDVAAVQFSYFGGSTPGQPQWRDEWRSEIVLPQLVRLRIRLKGDDGHSRSDLFIAPRIDADVSCLYDALTKRCRGR